MSSESIRAVTESLPPATDYLTYLTIVESHLSSELLPTLNNILQDAELTQNIGWDLIHLLLPFGDAQKCLNTIARVGNPREVVLKVIEALQLLHADDEEEEARVGPSIVDQFCILVNLLSILHPRIKTKYPSRFLSTSLIAILHAYRPSNQATVAVINFVHAVSGKKRPPLPGRKSSLKIPVIQNDSSISAPDPEAQSEDPNEAGIEKKLLQSFITHILEEYINVNILEWAARLQESFDPEKIVEGRKSLSEAFQDEPELQTKDVIVGQIVALARDLGLSNYETLFDTIYKAETSPIQGEVEENHPTSPDDIPLSRAGSLFIITSFIFSAILFESKLAPPRLTLYPDHAKLVKQFIGIDGPSHIGSEDSGIVDAVLAIGLWLEHTNKFVSGPLEDEEFLQHLQTLSLSSANNPSPTLRYTAYMLTSSILHAHPTDRVRLTFITDTLEDCPFASLKASAVSWLKEEIITARARKIDNVFSSTIALGAAQPYLFPDISSLAVATEEDIVHELVHSFSFHMAVINFLYFIAGKQYTHVIPSGMLAVVEEIYLSPLRIANEKALAIDSEPGDSSMELQLLADRIAMSSIQIEGK